MYETHSASSIGATPTLHDQHTDAAVRLWGLPDESRQEPDERGEELTREEVDYLSTRDHAQRHSLGLYKLTCEGFPVAYEAATSDERAWPQARRRGWAKGGGPVKVETLLTPVTAWGDYGTEYYTGTGWEPLCTVRARSARHAVTVAQARHPQHRVRSVSMFSVQAERRIAATRRIA